jgi:hypothetical protein
VVLGSATLAKVPYQVPYPTTIRQWQAYVSTVIALRYLGERLTASRAPNLNDGDIVDYIMLCAGVPV